MTTREQKKLRKENKKYRAKLMSDYRKKHKIKRGTLSFKEMEEKYDV